MIPKSGHRFSEKIMLHQQGRSNDNSAAVSTGFVRSLHGGAYSRAALTIANRPMRFFADLHVHSKYSRATSRDLDLEHLAYWAARKGIGVVGTGDFCHPAWAAELKDATGVPIEGPHRDDQFWIDDIGVSAARWGMAGARTFTPDRWLEDGDVVTLGETQFEAATVTGENARRKTRQAAMLDALEASEPAVQGADDQVGAPPPGPPGAGGPTGPPPPLP